MEDLLQTESIRRRGILATFLLTENSHQGFEAPKSTPHQGATEVNSNLASGLEACLRRNDIGSRCSGKERDAESGLDYFLARYFSGAQGRFLSPDEFKGGVVDPFSGNQVGQPGPLPYADIWDPQTLNKYGYVRNNPLRYIDPDGHDWEDVVEAIKSGAEFGGGVIRGMAASISFGLMGAPERSDSDLSTAGQIVGTAIVGGSGTTLMGAGVGGGIITSPTGVGAVAGAGVATAGAAVTAGAAKNVGAILMKASGPKADSAPGVTAGGQATDKYGNKIGPSGERQINKTRSNTREAARNKALNEGSGATEHRNPQKGNPHFHPTDNKGKKKPNSTHHEYPE